MEASPNRSFSSEHLHYLTESAVSEDKEGFLIFVFLPLYLGQVGLE